ncbi:hypothetical protein GCM10017687_24210 [Streptomyces echinatus]
MPPVSPAWSPVAHFGGYQRPGSGVRQAAAVGEAVEESAQHHEWRIARGLVPPTAATPFDPCFSL